MTVPARTNGPNDGTLLMEDARIVFRNFAGREGMYNAEGDRNFCVLLEPDLAQTLIDDGWNVKFLKAREEGDEPQAYLQVSVKYRGRTGTKIRPPRLVIITSRGRTDLGEEECELLDWAEIAGVDLIIRPFQWAVNGKTGIKAYAKSVFITIQEDYLELKYNDVPIAGALESAKDDDIIDVESWDVPNTPELEAELPPWAN